MDFYLSISFFLVLVVLIFIHSFWGKKKNFLWPYYINIVISFVFIITSVRDNIRCNYERETLNRIVQRIIVLLDGKEYDYILENLKKAQKKTNENNFDKLNEIWANLISTKENRSESSVLPKR